MWRWPPGPANAVRRSVAELLGINLDAFLSPGFVWLLVVVGLIGWTVILLLDGIEGLRR